MNQSPTSVPITGAAAALGRALLLLSTSYHGGLVIHVAPGMTAYATGEPLGRMNGLLVEPGCEPFDASEALAKVSALGLPWTLQVLPGDAAAGSDEARCPASARHDVVKTYAAPLANYDAPPVLPEGMTIRQVSTAREADDFTLVLGSAFEMVGTLGAAMAHPTSLANPQASAFVGYADGAPVACGYLVADGIWAGIFAIGTAPGSRLRGYARAMTQWVMWNGVRAGASHAYLQASSMGLPLYESLGFRDTLEDIHYLAQPASFVVS